MAWIQKGTDCDLFAPLVDLSAPRTDRKKQRGKS